MVKQTRLKNDDGKFWKQENKTAMNGMRNKKNKRGTIRSGDEKIIGQRRFLLLLSVEERSVIEAEAKRDAKGLKEFSNDQYVIITGSI